MYSPDQADIDPRNPTNFAERETTRYYINPNQFSNTELDGLDLVSVDVDTIIDDQTVAKVAARNIAEFVGRPVVISCGDDEDFFTDITVA